MSFNFDDNLTTNKRKNSNPVRITNLLIIAGFLSLGILLIFLLTPSNSAQFALPDIDATVNARVNEYIERQSTSNNSKVVIEDAATVAPAFMPTVEPFPIIEGTVLVDNRMVEGNLNNDVFEIQYTYDGKANTPVVITMQGVTLESPAIVLTNPFGEKISASVTANQTIGDTDTQIIAALLPTDGQYVITATREDGRAGDAEGSFQLTLEIPETLKSNARVTGTAQSDQWQWHVYQGDDPFSISYAQDDNAYHPEVGVYRLNIQSELVGVGYLLGDGVTFGTLGRFSADELYFIAVGQTTLQRPSSSTISTSSYTLGVQIAR